MRKVVNTTYFFIKIYDGIEISTYPKGIVLEIRNKMTNFIQRIFLVDIANRFIHVNKNKLQIRLETFDTGNNPVGTTM